jgi:hypothetical protein
MAARDDKRRQQIAKLRAKGMTFAQVGVKLGVTGDCIAKIARSMGLQGRIKLAVDMRGKGRINKSTSNAAKRPGA